MSVVLELRGVDVTFGDAKVIDAVDLTVETGRTLGLVGESGSGKSTIARTIVGLQRPSRGQVLVDGVDVTHGRRTFEQLRRVQMIPQDPYASLDPRRTIGETLAEALDPRSGRVRGRQDSIVGLLDRVALPASAMDRYPHEFSGGQRQRIAIARAIAVRPSLVIADEVTSALDTSVQAEMLGV